MPVSQYETSSDISSRQPLAILKLTVSNHPGVLSHICNLFARRGFNLEGVFCLPVEDGGESCVWLKLREDKRLDQLLRQIEKLWDVREVRREKTESGLFKQLEEFFLAD